MTKFKYTFPHKSRNDMTNYLVDHEGYYPLNSWNGGFCLAWNIKVNMPFDMSGKNDPDTTREYDDAWDKYLEEFGNDVFCDVCDDALQHYVFGQWTPTNDPNDRGWKFFTNGRSNGWLVMYASPPWLPNAGGGWPNFPMAWASHSAFVDYVENLPFQTLRRFYRVVRILDQQLSKSEIKKEMEYQYTYQRLVWEEARKAFEKEKIKRFIEEMQYARPDMCGDN